MSKQTKRASSGRQQRRIDAKRAAQRRRLVVLGSAIGFALIVAIGLILVNGKGDAQTVAVVPAASTIDPAIPRAGNTLGNVDAPVLIEVWSDYQCPACKNFSDNVMPRLIGDFVATGNARIVYRDFAFIDRTISVNAAGTPSANGEGESVRAAEAAACAADQGAYWSYHQTLFANQQHENAGNFTADRLSRMADLVSLNAEQFGACLADGDHRGDVLASFAVAEQTGINSTPTVVVNGQVVRFATYAQLKEAIDAELAA